MKPRRRHPHPTLWNIVRPKGREVYPAPYRRYGNGELVYGDFGQPELESEDAGDGHYKTWPACLPGTTIAYRCEYDQDFEDEVARGDWD